jgi:hypothetical protein
MRFVVPLVTCAAVAAGVAGCATNQVGPIRPITIDEDVAWSRGLAEPDIGTFYSLNAATQAAMRNQIVTARMYIADMEYHYYEARLTKEMQEEGVGATAVELGLTTAATLVPVAQTKTLLAALATGVTGLDKAYNEKELLSNAIQALQTQMRADRKSEAGQIYAKMFKDAGNNTKIITPIAEYTLPMALSDADAYYQAGTIASAFIGLSKTVANAEHNADTAKANVGPNPAAVSNVVATATPVALPTNRQVMIIGNVNAPLPNFIPPPAVVSSSRIGPFEQRGMSSKDLKVVLGVLGCSGDDLGPAGSPARKALANFLTANGRPSSDRVTDSVFMDIRDLKTAGKKGTCS